jgi:hypothetical protein
MKKSVMKQWVKALRSGEYAQGKLRLCTVGGGKFDYFCCLGVLCDLYQQKVGDLKVTEGFSWGGYSLQYNGLTGSLPKKVRDWSGMKSSRGVLDVGSLAYHNDTGCKDFNEIADIIEEHWEDL